MNQSKAEYKQKCYDLFQAFLSC